MKRFSRRNALRLLLAAGAATCLAGTSEVRAAGGILIVSRKRLLNETDHARLLLAAEQKLTEELQSQVDKVKEQLAAEEQELTKLRPTLERDAFEARVTDFDSRVRSERRQAQQRAAALQNAFRNERVKLVEALGPILEKVRADHGAAMIVNSDLAMAADPKLDITDEVIALFNATVPQPNVPTLESIETSIDEDTAPQ